MLIFPVIVLLLPSVTQSQVEHHAAARLRLNRSFFTRAGRMAKRIIDHIPILPIPDINGSAFNYFSFHIQGLNVSELDFPRTKFTISDRGVTWNSEGGSITIALQYDFRFWPFKKTGFVNIIFADLRTNVSATVTTIRSRPHFEVRHCDAKLDRGIIVIDDFMVDTLSKTLSNYIIDFVRSALKLNMCLFITTVSDLANEFVEFQPEDIRLYRNIYLNYTADVDPVFREDFVEATCTFRADVIGNYSDLEENYGAESNFLNLARKVAFSMRNSPAWNRFKADVVVLNRNAAIRLFASSLIRLDMVLCSVYFIWDCGSRIKKRLLEKSNERQPLITRTNATDEPFGDSYQRIG